MCIDMEFEKSIRNKLDRRNKMAKVNDLSMEELRRIVGVIVDSIQDNEKTIVEFATDVGQILIEYDLV